MWEVSKLWIGVPTKHICWRRAVEMKIKLSTFGWPTQVYIYIIIEGDHVSTHETKSQITSLLYSDPSTQHQELYSGHGYKDFALRVWSFHQNYKLDHEIYNHKKRILGMALSPDGKLLCTLGADELMKLW